jgi:hypothetical protein
MRIVIAALLALAGLAPPAPALAQATPRHKAAVAAPPAATLDPAVAREFQRRLGSYVHLRNGLAAKLKPLSPTSSAADLKAREESLAAAIKSARRGAKPGDLIPHPVAVFITRVVAEDLKTRTPTERTGVFAELPRGVRPVVNTNYPEGAAMPTVPPLLLSKLPVLPDNLQYRFFGNAIVLVDADSHVIIDVIPDALASARR